MTVSVESQPPLKTCSCCGDQKPSTKSFWTPNEWGKAGWRSQCKDCTNRKNRLRARTNDNAKRWHVGRRNGWLKRQYGITLTDYDALFQFQRGMCKICHSTHSRRDIQTHLCVDHCHKTGRVRGLLCVKCNTLIGMLETLGSPSKICWNAQLYLKNSYMDIGFTEQIYPADDARYAPLVEEMNDRLSERQAAEHSSADAKPN